MTARLERKLRITDSHGDELTLEPYDDGEGAVASVQVNGGTTVFLMPLDVAELAAALEEVESW